MNQTLRREGVKPENIYITGNTAVDAITLVKMRIESDTDFREALWSGLPKFNPKKRLILVTGHRRESFGKGMAEICRALNELAARSDVEIVWPVHPNPNVLAAVRENLKTNANVHLVQPIEYLRFTALMMRAHIIITDSGGIQEEAPTLSKPVLVTRNETERPEAVSAGTAVLVGAKTDRIVAAATELLDDDLAYQRRTARRNPFGDGNAALRIVDSLMSRRTDEFA